MQKNNFGHHVLGAIGDSCVSKSAIQGRILEMTDNALKDLVDRGLLERDKFCEFRRTPRARGPNVNHGGFFDFGGGGKSKKIDTIKRLAKIAPLYAKSYPATGNWRFFAGLKLQQTAIPPKYLSNKEGLWYFCSYESPWFKIQAPFEYADFKILEFAFKNGSICVTQTAASGISISRTNDRLKLMVEEGFLEWDRERRDLGRGKFNPRWYVPTEKTVQVLQDHKNRFPECFSDYEGEEF